MKNYQKDDQIKDKTFFKKLGDSFRYAWLGIVSIFKEEPNFRVEVAVAVIVILLSWALQISSEKWALVLVVILCVLFAEIVNSIVERLCDIFTREHHIGVKFIKDVAAGGVLLVSILASIIGLIIFIPELLPGLI